MSFLWIVSHHIICKSHMWSQCIPQLFCKKRWVLGRKKTRSKTTLWSWRMCNQMLPRGINLFCVSSMYVVLHILHIYKYIVYLILWKAKKMHFKWGFFPWPLDYIDHWFSILTCYTAIFFAIKIIFIPSLSNALLLEIRNDLSLCIVY